MNFKSVELAFKWLSGEGAEYHDPNFKPILLDRGNLGFLWEDGQFSMLVEFIGGEDTLFVTIKTPSFNASYHSDLEGHKFVAQGDDLYVLGKDVALKRGWDDRAAGSV